MKILIADDHELFLNGLEFILISEFSDAQIVKAKSYIDIFDKLENNSNFDVIITDLAMPGANWFDAIVHMHDLVKNTPIIIISAVFDKEILQKTLEIGVAGYISKSSSNAVILSAINLVLAGGVYIPNELLSNKIGNKELTEEIKRLKDFESKPNKTDKKLTSRQIDVVKAISRGLSNKVIAYELGLTEGTVKVHITVIFKVLGVTNRTAAVMEAVKQGYIKREDAYL